MIRLDTPAPPAPQGSASNAVRRRTAGRWAAPVLLALLPLAYFWRVTLAGEVVYWGTPLLQFYPWRTLAVAAYRDGGLPLWNPWNDFGAPLAANFQTAAFSPLNIIYFLMPVETAMGWTIVMHVALGGVFAYWCGRAFGFSRSAGVFTALTYMFSGYLVSRAGFLSMVAVIPWFPAVLAAAETQLRAYLERKHRLFSAVVTATCVGMLLLAGHIQLAFYALLAACGYAMFRGWQLAAARSAAGNVRAIIALWALAPFAGSVALGCGLAAIQLLPTAELTLHAGRRDGPGFDNAMNYSLYPFQVLQVLAPDLMGSPFSGNYHGPGNYWEGTSYLGAATLLLVLFGVRFSSHPARWFLVALSALAWLFALGKHTPVYPWVFENIPGFGLFQAPARFLFWWSLAGALLAGLGVEALSAKSAEAPVRRWRNLALGGAVAFALSLLLTFVILQPVGELRDALSALLKASGILVVGAALPVVSLRLGRRFLPALAVLIAADLAMFGHGLNPTTSPGLYRAAVTPVVRPDSDLLLRTYLSETAFEQRFGTVFGFRTFGPSTVDAILPLRQTLYPNLGAVAGVPEVFNYDPLKLDRPRRLRRVVEQASDPMPFVRMMGVGWIIDRTGQARAVEPAPLPRAWFATSIALAEGKAEAEHMLATVDPLHTAVVEAPPDVLAAVNAGAQPRRVVSIRATDGWVALVETETEHQALLVVTESWYPGWVARIDGRDVPVYATNLAFRGVVVPAGHHTVEFAYEPVSVLVGAGVSGASLGILLMAGLWSLLQRRGQDGNA